MGHSRLPNQRFPYQPEPLQLHGVPRSTPTVCYGGSYGGNLAAYLRLQYPRQFDAALASSAVVGAGLRAATRRREALRGLLLERVQQLPRMTCPCLCLGGSRLRCACATWHAEP